MKKKNIAVLLVVIFLDLFTKTMIQMNLSLHKSIEIIPNFFSITYAKNTGAAWSLFSGKLIGLIVISAIGIVAFYWMYRKTEENDDFGRFSITLMIAGAFGNFFDRVALGYVRDFLDFVIIGYDFPIFNIADMALTIGVGLLLIQTLFEKEK